MFVPGQYLSFYLVCISFPFFLYSERKESGSLISRINNFALNKLFNVKDKVKPHKNKFSLDCKNPNYQKSNLLSSCSLFFYCLLLEFCESIRNGVLCSIIFRFTKRLAFYIFNNFSRLLVVIILADTYTSISRVIR